MITARTLRAYAFWQRVARALGAKVLSFTYEWSATLVWDTGQTFRVDGRLGRRVLELSDV